MIGIKLDAKLTATAGGALERHAGKLYARPGMRIVGVVELRHVERVQPAPDEDKEPAVKLRITQLEVANADQEDAVREAMQALYLHRNAQGTLDEAGDVDLADRTVRMTGGLLHAIEAARMRVAVGLWADQCRRALAVEKITVAEMRHELDAVAQGLERVLRGEPADGAA